MSEQDRIAFEAWALSQGHKVCRHHLDHNDYAETSTFFMWNAYQQATAEANKRMAELEGDYYRQLEFSRHVEKINDTLRANNHDLREALEVVFNNIEQFKSMWMRVPPFGDKVNKATRKAISEATSPIFIAFNETQEALSATPSESLQAK